MKKLFVVIMLFTAAFVFAAPPSTVKALKAEPDPKVPKNFVPYDQVVCEYNAKGQLVKESVLFDNGDIGGETKTYEYDATGNKIRECIYADGQLDDFMTFEYDKDGRLLKETEFGAKGKVKNFKTYEYIDGGKKVVRKHTRADGTYYRYVVKRYDASGNLLEKSEYRIEQ